MRDITKQLGKLQDHVDTQYPPVTAREAFTRSVTIRPEPVTFRWARAAAFAAGFGVLILAGAGVFLLQSGSMPSPSAPADQPVGTIAPSPAPTETGPSPVMVGPAVSGPSPVPAATSTTPTSAAQVIPPDRRPSVQAASEIAALSKAQDLTAELDRNLGQLWDTLDDPAIDIGDAGWAEQCCDVPLATIPMLVAEIEGCLSQVEFEFSWVGCTTIDAMGEHLQSVAAGAETFADAPSSQEATVGLRNATAALSAFYRLFNYLVHDGSSNWWGVAAEFRPVTVEVESLSRELVVLWHENGAKIEAGAPAIIETIARLRSAAEFSSLDEPCAAGDYPICVVASTFHEKLNRIEAEISSMDLAANTAEAQKRLAAATSTVISLGETYLDLLLFFI
jgi:hypothetical protein